jgi:digeranylgeranylglycerophospholipid reductase
VSVSESRDLTVVHGETIYDCLIIGGGPVGSYVASGLARHGHSVAVLEQKDEIGSGVCCTGIISRECFDRYCPDPGPVLTAARSARFYSPSGGCLSLERDTTQAYIVDRGPFDRMMAGVASKSGARYFLGSRVVTVSRDPGGLWVLKDLSGVRVWRSRSLVLACGNRPALTRAAGMGSLDSFLFAAQVEVNTSIDGVDVYFDQRMAFGGFAWLVSTAGGHGLAGVMARCNCRSLLQGLLDRWGKAGKVSEVIGPVRQKTVPLSTLPVTYGKGVIAVGESAGQVKPTTGGGIYFGFLCGEVAVDVIHRALNAHDLSAQRLAEYEKVWRSLIGSELRFGYRLRSLYSQLDDRQLDQIMALPESKRLCDRLLADPKFSFDYHSHFGRRLIRDVGWLAAMLKCGVASSAARALLGSEPAVARAFCGVL